MLECIKLIVWDLDGTLWKGVISEEKVILDDRIPELISGLTKAGIMNSVCSKNDFDDVRKYLIQEKLWDYFIFPSVNWTPKGKRLADLISAAGLRAENVLFVDDNIQNLEEAQFYCKGIHTCLPDMIGQLMLELRQLPQRDNSNKRLKQYKILENRQILRKDFSSNEEFLMSSDIIVEIDYDCEKNLDRIAELVARTNQLNYTKNRDDRKKLSDLIRNPETITGTVHVRDIYGDYGIVGFFALQNNRTVHFLFSCRILGMQVEQYIYVMTGCPVIDVKGEVVTPLKQDVLPSWINQTVKNGTANNIKQSIKEARILLKGPCDLNQIFSFINTNKNIVTEFTITDDRGYLVQEGHNLANIVTSLTVSEERLKEIEADARWITEKWFRTDILDDSFDIIFLSTLSESSLARLRRKATGEIIAHSDRYCPITNELYHNQYISGRIFDENIGYTSDELKEFSSKYEYVMDAEYEETIRCLDVLYGKLGKNVSLVLMLGSEYYCGKMTGSSYKNRHLEHKKLNDKIASWALDKHNVYTINYTEYIHGQEDYVDQIDHFQKRVYYDFAKELVQLTWKITGNPREGVSVKDRKYLIQAEYMEKVKRIMRQLYRMFQRRR